MRIAYLALFALLPAAAQELKLPASLDQLEKKASNTVDVTLDGALLQLASRFLSDKDADEAKVKRLVGGLKGIYVKSFEFDKDGEYQESDIAPLRAQLKPPAWSRIVGFHSKKNGDNAEVFVAIDGSGQFSGLCILSVEPRELTIVSIVGTIKPEDIRDLGGNFGIPKFDIGNLHKGGSSKEE
jgi:hypothetical protein